MNSEESNSETTSCEHRYLKFHRNWRSRPLFFRLCLRQSHFCSYHVFRISRKFLYSPHKCLFLRFVFCFSRASSVYSNIFSFWYWDFNNNICCKVCLIKNRFHFDTILNSLLAILLHYRYHFKRKIDVFSNSVSHQLKNTIWRNKCNASISVESP